MNTQVEKIKAEIERLIERAKAERVLHPKTILAAKNYLLIEDYNKLLSFINSLPEEPISEDLNTAASEYEAKSYQLKLTKDGEIVKSVHPAIKIAFIAGANWREKQMMKYGTEYQVAEGSMCPAMESIPILANTDMILLPKDKFKVGDKIKVIIIKED